MLGVAFEDIHPFGRAALGDPQIQATAVVVPPWLGEGLDLAGTELVQRHFATPAYAATNGSRGGSGNRSEEHTSELQSLMRISYAVFCLKKKNNHQII